MPDMNDMDLTREYADRNSEAAFASLVQRHINLVYSVALRFTRNSQDAQDVTQAVLIVLAQKAGSLRHRALLTGWLYETTRFVAIRFLRTKARREMREQKAYMESLLNDSSSENVWQRLAPLLEEAMTQLSEKERTLIALRFFENKTAAETAALLGVREWAAHKRAARAVEKLRLFFTRRGIAVPAAVLTATISANAIQAAPVAFAKTATAIAFTKGATASTSTLTLTKGALKLMAWTKLKTVIVAGAVALLVAGAVTVTVTLQRAKARAASSHYNFSGYATPEASVQSMIWAAGTGELEKLPAGVTAEQMEQFRKKMKGQSPGEISHSLVAWANAMAGYRITQKEVISDDEVHLHIHATPSAEALHSGKAVIKMKKIGNEWKWAGDVN
jgi:RNA polymerase sigma factor (sigma-70 family)